MVQNVRDHHSEEEMLLLGKHEENRDPDISSKKFNPLLFAGLALGSFAVVALSLFSSRGAPAPGSLQFNSNQKLGIKVFNEYGALAEHTKEFYGFFDFVVEPGKVTSFSVENGRDHADVAFEWELESYDPATSSFTPLHQTEDATMEFKFTAGANTWFRLHLKEKLEGEETREFVTDKIVSKYVRREIRSLSDADREQIFSAMEILYNTDLEEGRAKYGENFRTSDYLAAVHSSTLDFCYHWGDMFITTHPAFQLWFEQSLLAIDPTLTASFYWDFTLDDALYQEEWWNNSPLYADDWFGSASGSVETQYQLVTGRFANLKVPTHKPDEPFGLALYNSYGFIGQVCDNSDSEIIQRSTSFCGLKTKQRLASADDMINCFMSNTAMRDWDLCLEINVHGNLHSYHGGAWDCYDDLKELSDSDPHTFPPKLMDFIGVSAFNFWFKEIQGADGMYECVSQHTQHMESSEWPCNRGDESCAEITKLVDLDEVTNEELFSGYANVPMEFFYYTQRGEKFLSPVESSDSELSELGALYKWSHLPSSEQVSFTRWFLKFGSNPGKTGIASTGAAPADPLFWAWHSLFDKMLHVMRLAPHFQNTYDMTWVPTSTDVTDCGAHWLDHLPFENLFVDAPKDVKFTNKQLWELLDPTKGHLPYIYDQFQTWGETQWDPLDVAASAETQSYKSMDFKGFRAPSH